MSGSVWIAHPGTGGRVEIPEDALAMYRQSGWDLLDDAEVKAQEKAAADEIAAAEKAMQAAAAVALGEAPPPTADAPAVAAKSPPKPAPVEDAATTPPKKEGKG